MYLSPDDAKTDLILAAAVAVLGVSLRAFVAQMPGYPGAGLLGAALDLAWIVALTALVPWLLARHRGDGTKAFGIAGYASTNVTSIAEGRRWALGAGLLVAVPVAAAGVLTQLLDGRGGGVVLGRLGFAIGAPNPALELTYSVARITLLSAGALVLVGFLASRAREGFPRSPDTDLTQLVRTIGAGAVLVALVAGLLTVIAGRSAVAVLVNVLALVGVVLLADRLIPVGVAVPRAAMIAPVVVVVAGRAFTSGGIIFGDLLGWVYTGALACGLTLMIAALAQTRRGVLVAVPALIAAHWWPTCLSPVVLAGGIC